MLLGQLLFQFALLFADFGPSAVWHPPPNFRDTVLSACNNSGAGFGECLAHQMKLAGASPDSLAFTRLIHNNGYIEAFRPVSHVGVAEVLYPFRANENYGNFLVNGRPPAIDIDDLAALPAEAIRENPLYKQMLAAHPKASLWPGDRSTPDTLLAVLLAGGAQEFIADYRVQDGCHACAVLGQAFFAFSFDENGEFHGVHFVGFSPHYSFGRLTTRKTLAIKPSTVFTIVLPADPVNRYQWTLAPLAPGSHLEALGHRAQPGSHHNQLWTFRTRATGEAALDFAYGRPGQQNPEPPQRVFVTLQIR